MGYEKLVKRVTLLAVLSSMVLIVIKVIGWRFTGSVTLLASLFDSVIDMFASGINFVLIRYALMPADRNHSFGHGKAEPLAALIQSAFIVGSSVFLLLSSIKTFINPMPIGFPFLGIIITLISLVLTIILISYQYGVIKRTGSQAVKADMLHYKSDVLMNTAVLIALLLTWCGFLRADSIFAFFIGFYILYSAFHIGYTAIQSLLDTALSDDELRTIEKIVCQIPTIKGVHGIRTRQSGKTKFIQLHLELPDAMPLITVHAISEEVTAALDAEFPGADILIHQDPESVVPRELTKGGEMPPINQKWSGK